MIKLISIKPNYKNEKDGQNSSSKSQSLQHATNDNSHPVVEVYLQRPDLAWEDTKGVGGKRTSRDDGGVCGEELDENQNSWTKNSLKNLALPPPTHTHKTEPRPASLPAGGEGGEQWRVVCSRGGEGNKDSREFPLGIFFFLLWIFFFEFVMTSFCIYSDKDGCHITR